MNNWKETTLGEIAKNVSRRFCFSGKEKVIFINTGDVQYGKFLHKNYLIIYKGFIQFLKTEIHG